MAEQQPVNSTLYDVQSTEEFQKLTKVTEEDLEALSDGIKPLSAKIVDEKREYNQRIQIIGEAIACTLLAHDHRGGYLLDNNGIQKFKKDFQQDFGFEIEDFVRLMGLTTVQNFLLSDLMSPYVHPTTNSENKQILRGRPFDNELLTELLVEQKLGHDATEQKANLKNIERRVRMDAARINPESVAGRLKIYKCVHNLQGPAATWVPYQDVQKQYEKTHGTPLNKAELKRIFGVSEAVAAFDSFTSDDLILHKDPAQTGSIFLRLKRSYEEIKQSYEKALAELENLPNMDEIADLNKKYANEKRAPIKPKKVDVAAPNFVVDEDSFRSKNALFSDFGDDEFAPSPSSKPVPDPCADVQANRSQFVDVQPSNSQFVRTQPPKPAISSTTVSSQKKSAYTAQGDGQYSDESDDEEEDLIQPSSTSSKPLPVPSVGSKPLPVPSIVDKPSPSTASFALKHESPTIPLSSFASTSEIQGPSLVKESEAPTKLIAKAFAFGILKSVYPLLVPFDGLVSKTESYVKSQGLKMDKDEVALLIRSFNTELTFYLDGEYVAIAKTRRARK